MAWNALDGVAVFIEWETLGTQCHALIELHVVAYDAGSPYHHTCAVIYGEVVPDGGSWMYVDACFAVCHLGDEAGDDGYAQLQQTSFPEF